MGRRRNNVLFNILRGSAPWAILPQVIDRFLEVYRAGNIESFLSNDRGEGFHGNEDPFQKIGSVALIRVRGAIFGEENCETELGAGTSNEYLQIALELAASDPTIKSIVLDINSPGGEVAGTADTANLIRRIRSEMPVYAYVGDLAASAAYWIASQATRIVISETAAVGSIGVRAVVEDHSEALKMEGIKQYTYLSSQSPNKDFDPKSAADVAEMQRQLDYLASLFIESVAIGRGKSAEFVAENFGRGGIIYGQMALDVGMADQIGTLSDVLTIAKNRTDGASIAAKANTGIIKPEGKMDAEIKQAVESERGRVAAILAIPTDSAEEKQILEAAIASGENPGDTALKILEIRKNTRSAKLEALKADAAQVPVVSAVSEELNSDEQWIAKMASAYQKLEV